MGESMTPLLCCGGVTSLRTRFRTRFGIKGNACDDCIAGHFLCCCAICQMVNEIQLIEMYQ